MVDSSTAPVTASAHGAAGAAVTLLLLRHGEVASHRGDVPVTEAGLATARRVGTGLAARFDDAPGTRRSVRVLSGHTLRTQQTAEAVADGARAAGLDVDGPRDAFALRNPDVFLAGERVDMVSTPEAFAAQVPGLDAQTAAAVPFVAGFVSAPDRIAWWLRHPRPPGDSALDVRTRIVRFARSLLDEGDRGPALVVGVTHSPVIRACALADKDVDPGEPAWVSGVEVTVTALGAVRMQLMPDAVVTR